MYQGAFLILLGPKLLIWGRLLFDLMINYFPILQDNITLQYPNSLLLVHRLKFIIMKDPLLIGDKATLYESH